MWDSINKIMYNLGRAHGLCYKDHAALTCIETVHTELLALLRKELDIPEGPLEKELDELHKLVKKEQP